MCLERLSEANETIEWLKTQPDIVTAYKVVEIKDGKVYPSSFNDKSFEKTNKLEERSIAERITTRGDGSIYQPYYHFFIDKRDAKKWAWKCEIVLKCEIPKGQITAMGEQADSSVIIAKEFTFTERTELFKEEQQCA